MAAIVVNEQQLTRTIKVLIAKGDKAREKSEQFYIAAGQHLKTLKAQHKGTWAAWESLLKDKIGIGKSRASELMEIADGRKTVEEVRSITGARTKKSREVSPLRSGEDDGGPELRATLNEIGAKTTDDVDRDVRLFWCHFTDSNAFKMWEMGTPKHRAAFLKILNRDARDRALIAKADSTLDYDDAPIGAARKAENAAAETPITVVEAAAITTTTTTNVGDDDFPELPQFLKRADKSVH
jgi:hypothetical protein